MSVLNRRRALWALPEILTAKPQSPHGVATHYLTTSEGEESLG